jgi:hypothetical protein
MYFLIIFIFIDCSKLLIGMVTPMYNKPLTEKAKHFHRFVNTPATETTAVESRPLETLDPRTATQRFFFFSSLPFQICSAALWHQHRFVPGPCSMLLTVQPTLFPREISELGPDRRYDAARAQNAAALREEAVPGRELSFKGRGATIWRCPG